MRIPTLFLITIFLFGVANYCKAQEAIDEVQMLSAGERLRRVEEMLQDLQSRKAPYDINVLRKAERELKGILEADSSSVFKAQVEANLDIVNERLAFHNLQIASFYMNKGHGHSLLGARSRLQSITQQYPKFSKMDEVLYRLIVVSVAKEKEDETVHYGWSLICNYPKSDYLEATFAHLNKIGVSSWEGCEKYKLHQ